VDEFVFVSITGPLLVDIVPLWVVPFLTLIFRRKKKWASPTSVKKWEMDEIMSITDPLPISNCLNMVYLCGVMIDRRSLAVPCSTLFTKKVYFIKKKNERKHFSCEKCQTGDG
jgi:hypothetical protein